MLDRIPGVPENIRAALVKFQEELVGAAGKNLAGLILYGGAARGRYRPGKSDVNVVVLLHEITAAALAAIAPALRSARRAAGVDAMILTLAEVAPTAVVFPVKFLDIRDHHIVLHGDDPFARLEVPREQLRLRVVQELRNLTYRLRRRFAAGFDGRVGLTTTLANLARPLAVELIALLRLAGKDVPSEDRSAVVFGAAASAFGVDGEPLARLAALRHGEPVADDLPTLFGRVFATLAKLIECAEQL
ncbi:MAG: nucleotidyltransferase domain-containing protein [Planctomycetes bacterium]|nr:nucleotidyltransferase domain-containing protein [Planctomycetota bacterium]